MQEISISKSKDLPKEFYDALEKWKIDYDKAAKENDICWFSKYVSTTFEYNNKYYCVTIYDICDEKILNNTPHNVLEAILETIQGVISNDLSKLGANNIRNWGFLD